MMTRLSISKLLVSELIAKSDQDSEAKLLFVLDLPRFIKYQR